MAKQVQRQLLCLYPAMDPEIRSVAMFNKKGVSLITVLLFMLVATIAATATFKWLTSENKSSSSRMEIQEARLSANAGIQSIRAWMTNNANDVGALIKQYLLNGKQPILLNSRVAAHINRKQNFNVWLTGVTEINGHHKLKILSEGISRDNSKYTEAAIINVSGLYQVTPPEEEVEIKNIAYDYSYFGASISNHGSAKLSSMLINGNWYGNPLGIDKNIIITGNAKLSGNNVYIYGTGCFGGDLFADNGIDAANIYVAGTSKQFGTKNAIGVSNHAYFDGVLEQDQNREIRIGGNMTSNNKVKTSMGTGSAAFTIEGNLCLGPNAQVQIGGMQGTTPQYNCDFRVDGDVWITHPYSFYARDPNHGDFHEYYNKIILGNKNSSKVYIIDAYPHSDYVKLRENKTFIENSNYRQHCSNPISIGYGQYGCYNKNSNSSEREYHQWDYWHDDSRTPYGYIAPNSDMYYFYYVEPGVTDVEFKEYNNTYWKNRTAGAWESPSAMGAYFIGGKVYHKTNEPNTWAEYNYGDGFPQKRSPYCIHNNDKFRPECHVSPWFKSNGTVTHNLPSSRPIACADSVRKVCYDIWKEKPGCDGAKFKVDDILKTAYDAFEDYANKGCAKNITEMDENFVTNANSCYDTNIKDEEKKKTDLYNGYLVVKVTSTQKKDYSEGLKGKFIIIVTNKPSQMAPPPTAGINDYVFLYLQEGAGEIVGQGTDTYNYFIYTKGNVGSSSYNAADNSISPSGGILFNNATLSGSVYAEAASCSKVAALTSSKEMKFNHDLLNSLNQSRIICDASVTNCGGVATSSSSVAEPTSSASAEGAINGKDPYFISIAPQLGITLETQYKSSEDAPADAAELDPSILILPRIIYLPKDAPGTLADYYSVINLNGANEVKNASNVSCNPSIPPTGKMYTSSYLDIGTHRCEYKSQNYGDIPFYVVVSDASGDLPEVNFTERDQSLELGEEVTVSVKIDKSKAVNGKIKFDFSFGDIPSGWTVTPPSGATYIKERSGGFSGRHYYTVEVTPNASEDQIIDVLKVSTEADAQDGDIHISLTTPTEQCIIGGSKNTHHVYVRGHLYITRASISDYCDNFTCDAATLEKSHYPDCIYEGEWITVSGTGCSEIVKNDRWSCLTNTAISLVSVNESDIPSNCEIVIPTDNNSIDEPHSGESQNLYASLKHKKVELTVKLKDNKDDDTYVRVYDQMTSTEHRCTKNSTPYPCQYNIIAGAPIIISHEDYGEDKESFAFWRCSGDNCSKSTYYNDEEEFRFYSSHTITADYGVESHCYYDDFSQTTAFCDTDAENCIDTCATIIEGEQVCDPRNSKQPKSHWLMTYHNNGKGNNSNYIRPNFGSGSIFAPNNQNGNNQSGKVSVILRNKNAGQYGTMNALIQTAILASSNPNEFLNTGFIFRSNGKEHLILNVYGTSTAGKSSGDLTFRVCKVVGQAINNKNQGDCKLIPKGKDVLNVPISSTDFIKVAFTIDNKDLLTVNASVNNKAWSGELSIKDFGFNDITHTYVGFSLADPEFKIFDNGWTSASFNDQCWELPSISCSFADKYVGETVPLNEEVTPKVIISSWFTDKNCVTEYHYNGCDNATSLCVNGTGEPGEIGATLSGSNYKFTAEGAHGYLVDDDKRAQDASVKVVCPGEVTSLDLAKEYYSCGTFWVGKVTNCSSELSIPDKPIYLTSNVPEEISTEENGDGYINMRGSILHIDIETDDSNDENNNLNANLEIQLQSTNGIKSSSRLISTAGHHEIGIDNLSNIFGFDPQHVSKIIITSDNNIYIKNIHIANKCSNKLSIECEKAHFDPNKGWKVDVKVHPMSPSIKCSYTSSDNNIEPLENIIGCTNSETFLTYKENGYYWLGSAPSFTVTALDNNGSTVSCTVTGENLGTFTPTCSVIPTNITTGSDAPTFSFKIGEPRLGPGWDRVTANYRVSLDDDVIKEGSAKLGSNQNISSDTKPSSGEHQYKVETWFGNGPYASMWAQSCTADFNVEDGVQKTPPTINCESSEVDNNGSFTVSISNPDEIQYTYTFGVTDPLGNVFAGQSGSSNETSLAYSYTPGMAGSGTYRYSITINGGETQTCTKTLSVTSTLSATCPTTITNQNPENIINVSASAQITINGHTSDCTDCEYKILYNNVQKNENNELFFYDNNATGTRTYRFEVSDNEGHNYSCNFNVSFQSQQSGDIELTYGGGNWTFISEGTHKIACTGNQYSGHLICKCPNAVSNYYDCQMRYNGMLVEVQSTQNDGKTVDGQNTQCYNGYIANVEILAPKTSPAPNSNQSTPQGKGMYCKHDW